MKANGTLNHDERVEAFIEHKVVVIVLAADASKLNADSTIPIGVS